MTRTLTAAAFLATLTIPVAHAETPSAVLQSLPAEVLEEHRASSNRLPGGPERRGPRPKPDDFSGVADSALGVLWR